MVHFAKQTPQRVVSNLFGVLAGAWQTLVLKYQRFLGRDMSRVSAQLNVEVKTNFQAKIKVIFYAFQFCELRLYNFSKYFQLISLRDCAIQGNTA